MVVNPVAAPGISISVGPHDTVCAGTAVTYTSSVTGAGSAPAYQWRVNGSVVGAGSSYVYAPSNGDSVSCMIVSNAACTTTDTAVSNMVHMVVNPVVTPVIAITTVHDTICSGTMVTYTSAITGGGSSPGYQWLVNGIVAGTGNSYSYTPVNGDSISCVFTSSATCATSIATLSNTIHMVVYPAITPSIVIYSSSSDTVCGGTLVTFTSTIAGGGSAPTYQWHVNGAPVGSGGSSYAYIPANGDSISCTLTSSAPCTTTVTNESNTIQMVVYPVEAPSIVIIASPGDTLCGSGMVVFTSVISMGGSSPTYQWVVDGVGAGMSTPTYTYTPANGDSVRCILTSNALCAMPHTISSNTINIVVDTLAVPTISLSGPTSASIGTVVTISAIVTGAGSTYTIEWMNQGVVFNTTTVPTVSYAKVNNIDSITARVVPQGGCYDSSVSGLQTVFNSKEGLNGLKYENAELWPNPASDILHISTSLQGAVRIINITGYEVTSTVLYVGVNDIPIQMLPLGFYTMEIDFVDGERIVKKIIKN